MTRQLGKTMNFFSLFFMKRMLSILISPYKMQNFVLWWVNQNCSKLEPTVTKIWEISRIFGQILLLNETDWCMNIYRSNFQM